MKIRIVLISLLSIGIHSYSQTDTIKKLDSTTHTNENCKIRKYPPYLDTLNNTLVLRNQHAPFGRKFLRASGLVIAAEMVSFGALYSSPETFSKWDPKKLHDFKLHYKEAFTMPPIIDHDYWYINYLGHPYQGAYTYNALRSQGANILQSSLFTVGHSTFWEYVIEGSEERPSIQDLIVTPLGGIILGELCHAATVKMSTNGFKWYEIAFVCVFNPMYALNNGFKFAKPKTSSVLISP